MAGSGIAHMRGCPVQWGSGVAALLLVTALPCGVVQRVSRLGPDDSRLKGGGSDGSKKEAQVRCTRSKSPVRRAGADRRHLPPAIMPASRRAMSERMTTRASLLSKTLTVTIQLRNLEEGRADTDRASAQHRMCAIATNRRSRSSDEHPLPPVLRRATSRPAASCWLALERPQCRLGRRLRIGASEIVLWREDAERVGGAAGRLRNDLWLAHRAYLWTRTRRRPRHFWLSAVSTVAVLVLLLVVAQPSAQYVHRGQCTFGPLGIGFGKVWIGVEPFPTTFTSIMRYTWSGVPIPLRSLKRWTSRPTSCSTSEISDHRPRMSRSNRRL